MSAVPHRKRVAQAGALALVVPAPAAPPGVSAPSLVERGRTTPLDLPRGEARPQEPIIRRGATSDAPALYRLITANLEAGHLLPRTLQDLTLHAPRFFVATRGDHVIGCGELAPLSRTVVEIRSLVVEEPLRGAGLGSRLVGELTRRARLDGFRTLCAFTHDPVPFVRLGFSIVPHVWLPEKIATDCRLCPWFRQCGQYAMVTRP